MQLLLAMVKVVNFLVRQDDKAICVEVMKSHKYFSD